MNDLVELYVTARGVPICVAHAQPYIDDPLTKVTVSEYHAWLLSHDTPMTCVRCQGVTDDRNRNPMVDDFLGTNRRAWGERDGDGLEVAYDAGRAFASYLDDPNND